MNNNPPSILISMLFGLLCLIQFGRFIQLAVKGNTKAQTALNFWTIVYFIPIVFIILEPSTLPYLARGIVLARENIVFLLIGIVILGEILIRHSRNSYSNVIEATIEGIEDPELLYEAAHQLEVSKKYAQAIKIHNRIIDRNPGFYKSYVNLAALSGIQGQFHEAESFCRKAIMIEPSYANAHYYLGLALKEHGRVPEAIAELKNAVQLGLPDALLGTAKHFIEILERRRNMV